jgi:hypothetical protein
MSLSCRLPDSSPDPWLLSHRMAHARRDNGEAVQIQATELPQGGEGHVVPALRPSPSCRGSGEERVEREEREEGEEGAEGRCGRGGGGRGGGERGGWGAHVSSWILIFQRWACRTA